VIGLGGQGCLAGAERAINHAAQLFALFYLHQLTILHDHHGSIRGLLYSFFSCPCSYTTTPWQHRGPSAQLFFLPPFLTTLPHHGSIGGPSVQLFSRPCFYLCWLYFKLLWEQRGPFAQLFSCSPFVFVNYTTTMGALAALLHSLYLPPSSSLNYLVTMRLHRLNTGLFLSFSRCHWPQGFGC
jgi:hypothetical protein